MGNKVRTRARGRPRVADPMRAASFMLRRDLLTELEIAAEAEERSKSAIVREALRQYLDTL